MAEKLAVKRKAQAEQEAAHQANLARKEAARLAQQKKVLLFIYLFFVCAIGYDLCIRLFYVCMLERRSSASST